MLVTGFLVRTVPGRATAVRSLVESFPEVSVKATTSDRLACVWTGAAVGFEGFVRAIAETSADVVTVMPTFAGVLGAEASGPAGRPRRHQDR